jgi:hypothetical protein
MIEIDRSGTITTGGSSQSLAPANELRVSFTFQNLSSEDLYLGIGATAASGYKRVKVSSGSLYELPKLRGDSVNGSSIEVYGATTGSAFHCREI